MENILNEKAFVTLIIFIITLIIVILEQNVIKKVEKRDSQKDEKKKNTYINIIGKIIKYITLILGIVWMLQENGINVSSVLAGLGIVSVITGFALQDALKDLIMGLNILADNYFSIGDVVKINDIIGKVVYFSLKTTKIKDIENENLYIIANRNIDRTLIISTQLDIDLSVAYEEKTDKVEDVLNTIVEEAKNNEKIYDIKYLGINEFSESAIKYKIRIWCEPEDTFYVKRYVNKIVRIRFENNNITIPYTQIDIHTKK